MKDKLYEQLSALVDDELPGNEQALLLAQLSRDAALRARLSRYQLVKDVLANRVAMPLDASFSDRVMHALDEDDVYHLPPAIPRRSWVRPVAGLAVAASVALVAVLSVQSVSRQETPLPPLAATDTASTPATLASAQVAPQSPANDIVRVQDGQWNRQAPQVRDRLNGYLVQHNEYAASSGVQGVLPYVRIVGYDNGKHD